MKYFLTSRFFTTLILAAALSLGACARQPWTGDFPANSESGGSAE